MKLIHKFKSPNFNERNSNNIYLIIIHYTALKNIDESLEYLCNKKNKVSSHYLISNNGTIYNLVAEKKRAWHAGKSYWSENNDINSNSIGIELDYFPDTKDKKFNKKLLVSLIKLLKKLIKKYQIKTTNILGHSDVAPYRKIDPGKNFPWYKLEKNQVSFKILNIKKDTKIRKKTQKWFLKNNFISQKKKILFMLNYIGYDISLATKSNSNFSQLLLMYSFHFKFFKNYNHNKKKVFFVIETHFINILLTQLKK